MSYMRISGSSCFFQCPAVPRHFKRKQRPSLPKHDKRRPKQYGRCDSLTHSPDSGLFVAAGESFFGRHSPLHEDILSCPAEKNELAATIRPSCPRQVGRSTIPGRPFPIEGARRRGRQPRRSKSLWSNGVREDGGERVRYRKLVS